MSTLVTDLTFKDIISDRTNHIFTKMSAIDTQEILSPCTGLELDMLFYSLYKTREVSDIILDTIEEHDDNKKLTDNDLTTIATLLYNMYSNTWKKLKTAISTDISVTGQSSITETESLNYNGTSDFSKEITGANDIYGFDSEEPVHDTDATSTENSNSTNTSGRQRTFSKISVNGNQNNIEVVKRMLGIYQYDFYNNIFTDVSKVLFTANYN